MTDKQIIFKCDVDCIRKNTGECFELDCIKGQESILKQLKVKEQECEELKQLLKKIKFWIRELLKRTGQVVPYEIKEILQTINKYGVK